ncbi:MAG: hypothetical protein AB7F64_04740 [Gammaproteobacteria bacterium]
MRTISPSKTQAGITLDQATKEEYYKVAHGYLELFKHLPKDFFPDIYPAEALWTILDTAFKDKPYDLAYVLLQINFIIENHLYLKGLTERKITETNLFLEPLESSSLAFKPFATSSIAKSTGQIPTIVPDFTLQQSTVRFLFSSGSQPNHTSFPKAPDSVRLKQQVSEGGITVEASSQDQEELVKFIGACLTN